jgi:hypothetical protein
MLPRILAAFVLLMASAMAADPTADISATFTPKDGAPITAEAPRVSLGAATTIPLEIPGALRLVEISPLQEKENGPFTQLNIMVRDPGTILPGIPGSGTPGNGTSPTPSVAIAIAQALVKLESDKDIVFLKTPTGTWSVKVSSVSKP